MSIRTLELNQAQAQDEISVTPSSGNVFADLGLPDADELLVKSNLVMKINNIIEKRHLSQTQAAVILGIPQPKVSMIQNGKLRGFSVERLCHFLTLLGRDVEIVIKNRKKVGVGHIRVVNA
jgi:predicted XRE-type DNA-binding protein